MSAQTEADGSKKPEVLLYTDGACSGNPGPGGWGVVLMSGDRTKELSGAEKETTNNRMELTAVIEGLRALKKSCRVTVHSDSSYVINGFAKGWIENWQRNGWKTTSGGNKSPVKNQELWQTLLELSKKHEVTWVWVKGHADNPYNNRCDTLATTARQTIYS